jgi:hypothetical protein
MIKQGEVAFVKTTGEAVYVLGFRDPSLKIGDKDMIVEVRRPLASQEGIKHIVDEFCLGELESLDEQRSRFMEEQKKVYEKFGPKAEGIPSIN